MTLSELTSVSLKEFTTREFTTRSEQETFRVGQQLAALLTGGEVLLVNGALGAGKTVLVKGIMDGFGFDATEVTSPTFTLVNRYDARLAVYHLDLYRLDAGANAAAAVDMEELLSDEQAIIVIEWAERLGAYPLPLDATWSINIRGDGDAPRQITIAKRQA